MQFLKWPSAENTYREREIEYWLRLYPELVDGKFLLTEKIDGSNLQIAINRDELKIGSRNQWIDMGGSFQGLPVQTLLNNLSELITLLSEYAITNDCEVRLFGELFGQGILNRIDYGGTKRFLAFGIMLDGQLQPPEVLFALVPDKFLVPTVAIVQGLELALNYDIKFDSLILGKADNLCEGVVITPMDKVYADRNGSIFMFKKKNEDFNEKVSVEKTEVDNEVLRLNREFKSYFTESRLMSVFSKEGVIESPKQIGTYIRLVMVDATEEFLKDFGEEFNALDKSQQKSVLNIGGTVANMLKSYL